MSVCAKFQIPSLSTSGLKVPGGVVGCSGVWLRPILVFSFSLSQAEQKRQKQHFEIEFVLIFYDIAIFLLKVEHLI